jgi:anaerobic glycerol-3-phosphate dehydrogenase
MIEEPARRVPVYGEYEAVILGGGPAGIAAAVAAARAGRHCSPTNTDSS